VYPIDFFFRASKLYPERIALQSTTLTLTYRELASKVNALASALQAIDPQPQTRVAICAANTVGHATAILAVLAAGKVWVPLNARSTASEIKRITDTIEPSIVMSDAKGAELLAASSATWLRLDDSGTVPRVIQAKRPASTKPEKTRPKPLSSQEARPVCPRA
jgi:acyl-CoA synthetase (AMP-forming)/AMP-acid ligase II